MFCHGPRGVNVVLLHTCSGDGGRAVIRTSAIGPLARASRRDVLRFAFLSAATLTATELAIAFAPFLRVGRTVAFGGTVTLHESAADILARFAATDDEPILSSQGRFFLIRAPGGIAAAYRKCTHLGCAVPFSRSEGRFHCPCHQSQYDKRTALLLSGPAPRGLDLFHIREEGGRLVVSTDPFSVMVRADNQWHPEHLEVRA